MSAACRAAGVARTVAYRRRKTDTDFAAAWADAIEESLDDLEAVLRERAIEGTDKPVYYGGKKIGALRAYNDNLGMFLLRARRRSVFAGEEGEPDGAPDTQSEAPGALRARLAAKLDMYEVSEGQEGAESPPDSHTESS